MNPSEQLVKTAAADLVATMKEAVAAIQQSQGVQSPAEAHGLPSLPELVAEIKRLVRRVSDASYTQGTDESRDSAALDQRNDDKVLALLGEASAAIDRLAALAANAQPKTADDLRAAFEKWALNTPTDERTNWEVFQAGARAANTQAPAPAPETTRSQRLREAGFTARDRRLTCDECGAKFTAQMAPLHECEQQAESSPAVVDGALTKLLAHHAALLEHNSYAYFELAYTRSTGWMAWITDKPAKGEPGTAEYARSRKVIARGQGDTPEEAASDALTVIKAQEGEQS